jgi:predicted nucleic acid-binding protein
MALTLLDASVLIALLDPADALHPQSVRALSSVAAATLAIPASALAETLVVPARAGKLQQARAAVRRLDLRVTPIEEEVAVEAARLRGKHRSLRLPDALVLASGEVFQATSILTGDARWKVVSRRVTVLV